VRRFLNPKALALGLVGLVLMGVMVVLGLWQLSVYDDHQHADARDALHQPAVPLGSLLGPDAAFPSGGVSRPVTVRGTYRTSEQVYVRNMPGAADRFAVVTPLVTANGSAVLVVRGSRDTASGAAPTGLVRLTGVLEPSNDNGRSPNAAGITDALSVSSLVNRVGPDLYSGYVLLQTSAPQQSPALSPVTPPLADVSRWSGLRNLLYACQWWVFALFVAFMWWRMTDDLEPKDDRDGPVVRSEAIDSTQGG